MNKTTRILQRRTSSRARLAGAMLALTWAFLTSCSTDEQGGAASVSGDTDGYRGTLVADPPLQVAPVTLRDTDRNSVRLDQLTTSGAATAVFFGFTNCEDVCPTTMADLAAARRALPLELARQTRLVFITVDRERDTLSVLRTWLDKFDPEIVGLRGPVPTVHRAERSLYATESGKTPGDAISDGANQHDHHQEGAPTPGTDQPGYQVNHTSVVYLFGPDGETIIYTGDTTAADYTADFTRLFDDP